MKFTKKKLIITISILLVVCLLSTIAIYFFSPKSKFGVLCIGMTFEECHNALPKSESFYYGGYVFYTNAWGDYVVARFAGPYNNRSVVELKHFYKWTTHPTAKAFSKIEPGMSVFDVVALVGLPFGSDTSGVESLNFMDKNSNVYTIYLYGKDSENRLVTGVVAH